MTVQENKNLIRQFIKRENQFDSPLGTIDVKENIGEGGNALVYNAILGKNEIALKILAEQKDSTKYKRFITEFREIVQLAETQAVVPIYYLGHIEIEFEGTDFLFPYILMKKYPYTLKTWREKNEINNFDDLRLILKKLLNIVTVIHEKNIVHRDLKPENILVSEKGEFVLADFGISWFDPNFYQRFVHTGKGDRMANYDFSAPEQFEKGSEAHPTMDIFALGQIITWLITGGVARGQRTPLTHIDQSFNIIEPIISKMLARSFEERIQSITEIKSLLNESSQSLNVSHRQQKESEYVINNLEKFDYLLRYCFPGKRGLVETTDSKKIEMVLNELNSIASKIDLWWTQGRANMPINKFEKINSETWLMDYTEIKIDKVWIFKSGYSMDHQFICIKTSAMSNFEIYEYEYEDLNSDEAAWFIDRYISREEYDDGVAEIDGESVKIEGKAQLRVRNLKTQYYFIASSSNPIHLIENDSIVSNVYSRVLETNTIESEDIQQLSNLRRHRISRMLN
ncbi:protein kinase [Priestia megaterium]|uniref:protein kinase domain-containing protein n=1 Tax=Priestia megaterium TaxID=1404 RepID=UPI00345A4775